MYKLKIVDFLGWLTFGVTAALAAYVAVLLLTLFLVAA